MAFGWPCSLSRFDSRAGGTKGRKTAAEIMLPATADCNFVAGFVACAEKCRIADCARVFEMIVTAIAMKSLFRTPIVYFEVRRTLYI